MRRKNFLIMVSFLPLFILFIGTSVAYLNDHNHNTNREDGNNTNNNNNPYDEGPTPVQGTRQRSSVEW